MQKKTLMLIPILLLISCSSNQGETSTSQYQTNWTIDEIKKMNEVFMMPENGDSSLYTIPFMFIDKTYSIVTIDEINMVNYIVNSGSTNDVDRYFNIALNNGFSQVEEGSEVLVKNVPNGEIELVISYGLSPFSSSDAFVASGRFTAN